jgi:hypothetical protein
MLKQFSVPAGRLPGARPPTRSLLPRLVAASIGAALLWPVGHAAAQSRCAPLSSGMVGWWSLDEAGPVAADLAGAPQNGVHQNGPAVVSGQVRGALDFDRTSYVEAPSAPELQLGTGDFSFDAWLWVRSQEGNMSILDKRVTIDEVRGYHVFIEWGRLGLQLADGVHSNFHSGITLPTEEWIHVAITVDRDDPEGIRFYLNGAPAGNNGQATLHPGTLDTPAPLRLGGHATWEDGGLNGRLDEVELFNRVLSPTEVSKLFRAGPLGRCRLPAPRRAGVTG